jgi:anti-sigma28 factor (negative regulator of flagellin synthesis)
MEKLSEVEGASATFKASDSVHISSRSLEVQKARLVALQAPDIRQELVDEVVGLIGRGEYMVTGTDVAPKMIREHLMDAGR